MPIKRLPDIIKAVIVAKLACFETPTAVAEDIFAEYGVKVAPQVVEGYNPDRYAGRDLSLRWRSVFVATRKQHIEDQARIGTAHRNTRLSKLDRYVQRMEKSGNLVAAAGMLEQIAKEVGDAYTNRRELTGAGGGAIMTQAIDRPPNETREEWLARKAKERGETE